MRRDSVLSHLIRTLGAREGWHAARLLVAYSTVRTLTLDEGEAWPAQLDARLLIVADHDGGDRSTQYRRLARLRRAFPSYDDPEDLVLALEAAHGSYDPEAVLALQLGAVTT